MCGPRFRLMTMALARKYVDRVTMHSAAAMAFGLGWFTSATPGGIIWLLDAYDVQLEGAHAVVIGRSPILGKSVGMLLLGRTPHSHRSPLPNGVPATTRTADIVAAAVAGCPAW